MNWLILIISLTTENTAIRMRIWRAVKASGAAVLRDGVYLLPNRDGCRAAFDAIAADVQSGGGVNNLLQAEALDGSNFAEFFDRKAAYTALLAELEKIAIDFTATGNAQNAVKPLRKLRKSLAAIMETDFFPNAAQPQVMQALSELEIKIRRTLAPDEPQAQDTSIPKLAIGDYQARIWATRQRPWADRLASAWLIRRFIDPNAHIIWLESVADCPAEALGFDFDGASFSHIGSKVTFEVLLASFGLADPGLQRLAALVHYLDVGGVQTPEAIGVETILTGLSTTLTDDEKLLAAAGTVFDSLLSAFDKGESQ